MQTRQLGNSDMQITPIGFGAWAIGGGGWAYGWGSQDDNESIGAIQRALDLGINWIDTAPIYGLGRSEQVVARAIKGRTKPYLFTKCAMLWDSNRKISFGLKADSVRREVEASLSRLQIDVIDLYQIHWPNPDAEIEEAWATITKLKEEGKIRYACVSNFNIQQMERAIKIAPITSLQPPYSMLERGIETEILPFCQNNNIGVIGYSPMRSGLLTGKMTKQRAANFAQDDWRRKSPDFQEPRLSANLDLVDKLAGIGAKHGKSAGEVAIAWTLRHPAVTAAIVGARSAEQVDGIIGSGDFRLSPDELDQVDQALEIVKAVRGK